MLPQLLDVPTVAGRLGISPKTVYQYVELGEIPCVRIGRRVLFDERELSVWLETKRVGPRQPSPPLAEVLARRKERRRRVKGRGSAAARLE